MIISNRCGLLCLMLSMVVNGQSLFASSSPSKGEGSVLSFVERVYVETRDRTYNQEFATQEALSFLEEGLQVAKKLAAPLPRYLWRARLFHIKGRFLMEQVEESSEKKAISSFEEAMAHCKVALKIQESGSLYALKSASLAQLCRLKGAAFSLTHGRQILILAKRALVLDPLNAKALIILGNAKIYSPRLFLIPEKFRGNPEEGILIMKKAARLPTLAKDDLFNIRSGIGTAYKILAQKKRSARYLRQALVLYPNNRYVAQLLDDLSRGQ